MVKRSLFTKINNRDKITSKNTKIMVEVLITNQNKKERKTKMILKISVMVWEAIMELPLT